MSMPAAINSSMHDRGRAATRYAGAVAGLLGILFGLLGIFTIGLIFVPLAGLCSGIGLLRGMAGRGYLGVGLSLLGGLLAVAGFFVSPSLWILAGAGAVVGAVNLANSTAQVSQPTVPVPAPTQAVSIARPVPVLDEDLSTRVSRLTQEIATEQSQLSLIKSSSDKLQQRFVVAASKIVEFEAAARGQQFSPSRFQAALNVNNGYLQDGTAHLQIIRAKSDWSFKVTPLLAKMDQLNTACLTTPGGDAGLNSPTSDCGQLREGSIQFRIAAQAAKSSIDAAEAAYQREAKVGQNILHP